jgi:Caspase domain
MTTYNFNNLEDNQPQTHVFIIGVGRYEFLNNPSKELIPVLQDEGLDELRPLMSPPLAAKRFAKWMETSYRNIDAPLGSIEILTSSLQSEDDQIYGGVKVETPTYANVKRAFRGWLSRCNAGGISASKNIAIFYFCGHGLGRSNNKQWLLLENFGEDHEDIFNEGMIQFEDTRQAILTKCKASFQYYFIDSCCQVPKYPGEMQSSPLLNPGKLELPLVKFTYTLRAANPGAKAYGKPSGLTYFTDALLQSLDIFASECNSRNHYLWQVKSAGLKAAVDKTMGRISDQRQTSSYPEGWMDHVMHTLDKPPLLPTTIRVVLPSSQNDDIQVILKNSEPEYTCVIPPACDNISASREAYSVNTNQPNRYKSKTKYIYADRPFEAPLTNDIEVEAL